MKLEKLNAAILVALSKPFPVVHSSDIHVFFWKYHVSCDGVSVKSGNFSKLKSFNFSCKLIFSIFHCAHLTFVFGMKFISGCVHY